MAYGKGKSMMKGNKKMGKKFTPCSRCPNPRSCTAFSVWFGVANQGVQAAWRQVQNGQRLSPRAA
jgi:hypothetical protein